MWGSLKNRIKYILSLKYICMFISNCNKHLNILKYSVHTHTHTQ